LGALTVEGETRPNDGTYSTYVPTPEDRARAAERIAAGERRGEGGLALLRPARERAESAVDHNAPYPVWLAETISELRRERRRAQWRRYGQSVKGLARYRKYDSTPRGDERTFARYRRNLRARAESIKMRLQILCREAGVTNIDELIEKIVLDERVAAVSKAEDE
jgi:hypothetical protein